MSKHLIQAIALTVYLFIAAVSIIFLYGLVFVRITHAVECSDGLCCGMEEEIINPEDGQTWQAHWEACAVGNSIAATTIWDLSYQLDQCLNPPVTEPVCEPMADYKNGGRLWKPVSESHGTPAVLMPKRYYNQSFRLEDLTGLEVGSVKRKSCCANGDRAHWFLNETASSLSPYAPLRLWFDDECFIISDPEKRLD